MKGNSNTLKRSGSENFFKMNEQMLDLLHRFVHWYETADDKPDVQNHMELVEMIRDAEDMIAEGERINRKG